MKSRLETRQNRRNIKSKFIGFRSAVFLFAVVALLLWSAWIYKTVQTNTIYNGISINGISLGGMTKQQAVSKLKEEYQPRLARSRIRLVYETNRWDINTTDFHAAYDIEKKVEMAYQLGRKGNIINRYFTIKDIAANGRKMELEVTYDPLHLRSIIEKVEGKVNVKPKDAEIKFQADEKQKLIVLPEKEGKVLDQKGTVERIIYELRAGNDGVIPLKMISVTPKVFSKELSKLTSRIASFTTNLGESSEDRKHNVLLAAQAFNGIMVKPGETFSFNKITGERTIQRGYRNAPIITKDKSLEDGPGGGVCQASTTLYNSVLLAGLEVVSRAHHSFPPFYVRPGLDATVNYPTTDFCFKNNRTSPVFLASYRSNNNLVVEVYGEALGEGISYQLVDEVYQEIPAPEPEVRKDINRDFADKVRYNDEEYVWIQSHKGIKVKTYRLTLKDGKVLNKQLVADDFYKPIRGITYIGIEERDFGKLLVPQKEKKTEIIKESVDRY